MKRITLAKVSVNKKLKVSVVNLGLKPDPMWIISCNSDYQQDNYPICNENHDK